MRNAARTDANEAEIIAALRAAGYVVHRIKFPVDLLVGVPGAWLPMEVKTAKGKLTQEQARFLATAPGPVAVVDSVESALRACRAIQEQAAP